MTDEEIFVKCPVCGEERGVYTRTHTGVSFTTKYYRCLECGSTWKIRRIKRGHPVPAGEKRKKLIITHKAEVVKNEKNM